MSQTFNIQEAEKRVFRLATLDDGIWEIYLGLFFSLMSTYSLTRNLLGPVINLFWILGVSFTLVGLVWLAKRSFILPRVGFVRFGAGTKRKIRAANIVTWGLVILTFSAWVLSSKSLLKEPTWGKLPQWVSDFDVDLIFALVIIAGFSIVARSMEAPRFYFYGLLLGIGNFISTVLLVYNGVTFQWPTALAGVLIVFIGICVFSQFLRDHPLPLEVSNG